MQITCYQLLPNTDCNIGFQTDLHSGKVILNNLIFGVQFKVLATQHPSLTSKTTMVTASHQHDHPWVLCKLH